MFQDPNHFMETPDFDSKGRFQVKFCPCGRSNKDGKFVPYKGFEDKGFCHSCGQVFKEKDEEKVKDSQKSFTPPPPKPKSFIDPIYLKESLKRYDENNLVQFLERTFGKAKAFEAVEAYKIGTSKRWTGANVFWQIDIEGKIRSGKIMVYDPSTGKRDKTKNSWVHKVLNLNGFNLNQCLFGSHLLKSDPKKNVAIVESEKTAIIASILIPGFIWIAASGKDGLKHEKCRDLRNRNVFLFPDLTKPGDKPNCFELWTEKAKILSKEIPGASFQVSDYLETKASEDERRQGLDIADYFLKWEWINEENERNEASKKSFISKPDIPNVENERNEGAEKYFISGDKTYLEGLHFVDDLLMNGDGYPAEWDLAGSYTDDKTKEFIREVVKNPNLIQLRQ